MIEVLINNYNGFLVKEKCYRSLALVLFDIVLQRVDIGYITSNAMRTIRSDYNAALQYIKFNELIHQFYEECVLLERNKNSKE